MGISAAVVYVLFKNNDQDEDDYFNKTRYSKHITRQLKIPKDSVGVVIGRGGSNIKQIQEETVTKINFGDEKDESERVCEIRGSPESVEKACFMIRSIIANQPLIITSELFVPQQAVGRIIGKNGTVIRSISTQSSARINVDRYYSEKEASENTLRERRVVIQGTEEQVALAKSLILEKVEEHRVLKSQLEDAQNQRTPRKNFKQQYLTSGDEAQKKEERHPAERLIASGGDGLMEVYVSAAESPSQFWLQVAGPRAVELDHLVEQMTEFYQQEENKELHKLRELSVGQLVAAPFTFDGKWYRAEVIEVTEDDYDPDESDVTLLYVDYGDSSALKRKQVFELRTDFLRLRFQAIECSLANVKPSGETWSDDATEQFVELTYVAQWRAVIAKVSGYKERQQGRRAGSPVPCVELFDSVKDISVADELVKQGFAVVADKAIKNGPPKEAEPATAGSFYRNQNNNNVDTSISGSSKDETSNGLSGARSSLKPVFDGSSFVPDMDDSDEDDSDDLEMG